MLARALTDSHYGKPEAITRAFREPRDGNQRTRSYTSLKYPLTAVFTTLTGSRVRNPG